MGKKARPDKPREGFKDVDPEELRKSLAGLEGWRSSDPIAVVRSAQGSGWLEGIPDAIVRGPIDGKGWLVP